MNNAYSISDDSISDYQYGENLCGVEHFNNRFYSLNVEDSQIKTIPSNLNLNLKFEDRNNYELTDQKLYESKLKYPLELSFINFFKFIFSDKYYLIFFKRNYIFFKENINKNTILTLRSFNKNNVLGVFIFDYYKFGDRKHLVNYNDDNQELKVIPYYHLYDELTSAYIVGVKMKNPISNNQGIFSYEKKIAKSKKNIVIYSKTKTGNFILDFNFYNKNKINLFLCNQGQKLYQLFPSLKYHVY